MKRIAFWLLLLALLATVIVLGALHDHGYVLIVYPPWRLEMSFILALAGGFGLFILGYALLRLLRITLALPADVRAWRERRRQAKVDDLLFKAMAALCAGQPGHAGLLARKALDQGDHPMAALLAAQAALEVDDHPSCRRHLAQVGSAEGEFVAARQAMEARMAAALPRQATE